MFCSIPKPPIPTRDQALFLRPDTLIKRHVHKMARIKDTNCVSGRETDLAVARLSKSQEPLRPKKTMMCRSSLPLVKHVTLSEPSFRPAHFPSVHRGKTQVIATSRFSESTTKIVPQSPYRYHGGMAMPICAAIVAQPNNHIKSRLQLEAGPSSKISILKDSSRPFSSLPLESTSCLVS